MKKEIALVLAVLVAPPFICMGGCGNTKLRDSTAETLSAVELEDTMQDAVSLVSIPFTIADLGEIPVASPISTLDELRETCVRFMREQATIVWTPAETYKYECASAGAADEDGYLTVKFDTVYGGLPYTPASSNLYTFLDYYDEKTGVLTVPNAAFLRTKIGNNCADAVFWAWARVSSAIDFTATVNMVPRRGIVKVGDYSLDPALQSYQNYGTNQICSDNGEAVMCAAYAKILKGDGFVLFKNRAGHAFMASEDAVVVLKDGVISPDESYVLILEQHSTPFQRKLEDGTVVENIGGIDNKFTFSKLFSLGYLPVSIPEFYGAPVQSASASLNLGETCTAEELLTATLRSNYRISKVSVTIRNASGETFFEADGYAGEGEMHEFPLALICKKAVLSKQVRSGSFSISVKALIGTGQTLDVYHGAYQS